jgi:hypothetical protein
LIEIAVAAVPPESGGARVVTVTLRTQGGDTRAALLATTRLADRLASLADGIVHDEVAKRAFASGGWKIDGAGEPLDMREHVTVHRVEGRTPGGDWLHTHGVRKLGQPELEIYDVPPALAGRVTEALLDVAQELSEGAAASPGDSVGDRARPLLVRLGGHDREHWDDAPVLELVPARGFGAWLEAA